jgi:hypothetical protein
MSIKKMIASNLILTSVFCIFILASHLYSEIPSVIGWKTNVKSYINHITGLIRVKDVESEKIIFYYSSETLIYPEQIEKINENEWRVTFKKRGE